MGKNASNAPLSSAGMVGVGQAKVAERAARQAEARVQGRGGLALAPPAPVAGGAGAGHLAKPGQEGARAAVQAVARDGAHGRFAGHDRAAGAGRRRRRRAACRRRRAACRRCRAARRRRCRACRRPPPLRRQEHPPPLSPEDVRGRSDRVGRPAAVRPPPPATGDARPDGDGRLFGVDPAGVLGRARVHARVGDAPAPDDEHKLASARDRGNHPSGHCGHTCECRQITFVMRIRECLCLFDSNLCAIQDVRINSADPSSTFH